MPRLPRHSPVRYTARLLPVGPLLTVVLVLSVSGCGIDRDVVADRQARAQRDREVNSELAAWPDAAPRRNRPATSAFSLNRLSDGWTLVAAGPGERTAAWGSPSRGTDRPVTVLAPEGDPTQRGVVFVEVSSPDDRPRRSGTEVEISGRAATYYRDVDGWDLLLTESSPDTDLRVWAVDRDAAALGEIALATMPPGHRLDPPTVEEPPAGLAVAGSLDAEAVVALRSPEPDPDGLVPGPPSAHVLSWVRCDDQASGRGADSGGSTECESLVAMTLPAGSLDPLAVLTEVKAPRRGDTPALDAAPTGVFVGDATAIVTTTADPSDGRVVRSDLAVTLPWGDVLLLTSRGPRPLPPASLGRAAESVAEVTAAQWEAMIAEVGG